MKKTVFVLNVENYAPEITELTYPLIKYYANKIGADFYEIKDRKYPEWPVTYEKLQIYDLAKELKSDWYIYIDSDALIHPETIDWTNYLPKDTIAHNGNDMANIRWRYDEYFKRDGRDFGSCNWYTVASDWCIDLWHPLDIKPDEAVANIFPTIDELNTVITPSHLIDDYALSRNIARYGLKATTLIDLQKEIGLPNANFHWHIYTDTIEVKIERLKNILDEWNIPQSIRNYGKSSNN